MGDRVLIQLKNSTGYSPALYLHWGGSQAHELLEAFASHFLPARGSDLAYAFARLVGRAHNMTGGDDEALGMGVWPSHTKLTAKDSHGDAGVMVLDLDIKTVYCAGGYAPKFAANSLLNWQAAA